MTDGGGNRLNYMVRGRTWANQHRVRECGRRTTVYNGSQRFLAVPARSECHRPDQTDARIHAVESHVGIKLACRSGKVRCCTALPEHVRFSCSFAQFTQLTFFSFTFERHLTFHE